MPVDEFGNRADVIASGFSTVNRSNPARMHEQAIGAAGRDVIKRVRRKYGLPDMAVLEYDEVMRELKANSEEFNKAQYEYILGFYKIVSYAVDYQKSLELLNKGGDGWLNDLCHIILDGNDPKGMYITTPSNSKRRIAKVIRQLDESDDYRPEMSPVTYRGPGGEMVTSIEPILIGPNYYLSLEKTATDGSGTSITKLGHHGTPTRLTNVDKHTHPARETGTKTDGEAEIRNWAKTVGTQPIADMSDLYSNPALLKVAAQNILTHQTPTNIPVIIPRDVYSLGGHRPLSYMNHLHLCSGIELTRDDVE